MSRYDDYVQGLQRVATGWPREKCLAAAAAASEERDQERDRVASRDRLVAELRAELASLRQELDTAKHTLARVSRKYRAALRR